MLQKLMIKLQFTYYSSKNGRYVYSNSFEKEFTWSRLAASPRSWPLLSPLSAICSSSITSQPVIKPAGRSLFHLSCCLSSSR